MSELILLVEDEEHDVLFMQIAMEDAQVKNALVVVKDGREAIAYLKGEGKFADRKEFPLPVLVLLDLKLPQVPGLDVLKWIRSQPDLEKLRVIVYSSSDQDSDIEAAYKLGADSYVVKTSQPIERMEIVRRIKQCWLDGNSSSADSNDWVSLGAVRRAPTQNE